MQKIDGIQAFEMWAKEQAQKTLDPLLKKSSTLPYDAVWISWLRFISERKFVVDGQEISKDWRQAMPSDVLDFLRPRAGLHANHEPGRRLSEVTRRRYWSLLERIYDFAFRQHWITDNPASLLMEFEQPSISPQLGHILPGAVWQALPLHFPHGNTLSECRDCSIMHTLYSLALSPEEVRSLKPESIIFRDSVKEGDESTILLLQIDGPRLAQKRIVALNKESANALRKWMSARKLHVPSNSSAYLFCAHTGEQLSISALFHLVSKIVLKVSENVARDVTSQTWTPRRVGPQVLRNTAIVHWLNAGQVHSEVLRRAGIKSVKGLYHLRQHLNAEIASLRQQ